MATQQQQVPPPSPSSPSCLAGNTTTYVQADPSTFRTLVQKLTGAPPDSPNNRPVTLPARSNRSTPDPNVINTKRQKLRDRRCVPAKLEIDLGPSATRYRPHHHHHQQLWSKGQMVLLSPLSTMDSFLLSSPSPTTPLPADVEEERAIAEKGFYLHPSPRGDGEPPKLLPLFPLHSPHRS